MLTVQYMCFLQYIYNIANHWNVDIHIKQHFICFVNTVYTCDNHERAIRTAISRAITMKEPYAHQTVVR